MERSHLGIHLVPPSAALLLAHLIFGAAPQITVVEGEHLRSRQKRWGIRRGGEQALEPRAKAIKQPGERFANIADQMPAVEDL